MSDSYQKEGMDLTKLGLRFIRKIWIPILALVLGALALAGIYQIWYSISDQPCFQTVSKVYLDFAADETGEVYQYYNGYTWNDLMSTSPIIDETMNGLAGTGIDRELTEQSVKAEILSDIRLLTITVTTTSEQNTEVIRDAVQSSLEKLGKTAKEFRSITVVKTGDVVRIHADRRIRQAVLLGAVLGLLIALLTLAFYAVMDDRIFVPGDVTRRLNVPVLGISMKTDEDSKLSCRLAEEQKANLEYLETKKGTIVTLDACELLAKSKTPDYELLRAAGALVIRVPYGKVRCGLLEGMIAQLSNQDLEVSGVVICEGDPRFLEVYYRL